MARGVFMLATLVLVAGATFLFGLYSGYERNRILAAALDVYFDIRNVRAALQTQADLPVHHLQRARHDGDGVTVNEVDDRGELILLASYFDGNNGLRLIRRDGTVAASWTASYEALFPDVSHLVKPPVGDRNTDIHGSLVNPDGSVVFNFESVGTAKFSLCGDVEWTLRHPTHHSVVRSERGGYLIPGRVEHGQVPPDLYQPFTGVLSYGISEDLVLRVSEAGEIVDSKPVFEILYENDLQSLVSATGYVFSPGIEGKLDGKGTWADSELVHMNKITELPEALADRFPGLDAGDLAISLRDYNLVFIVDPDDWRVKWRRTGPWIRQHDPEFTDTGRIAIFNNNLHLTQFSPEIQQDPSLIAGTNIMEVDPVGGDVEIVYGDRPGEEMLSFIRGKHQPLPDGHYMITEFEAGRAFEIDARGGIVWEYINRYDDDHVAEITEARVYTRSYFDVTDWSCPQ